MGKRRKHDRPSMWAPRKSADQCLAVLRLNRVLTNGFDTFAKAQCAAVSCRRYRPPSQRRGGFPVLARWATRTIAWHRPFDSSRQFLGRCMRRQPTMSTLSRTVSRDRDAETIQRFAWVVAAAGGRPGQRGHHWDRRLDTRQRGDGSDRWRSGTCERTRRGLPVAEASGIATATRAEYRFDRKRTKKGSNDDWRV